MISRFVWARAVATSILAADEWTVRSVEGALRYVFRRRGSVVRKLARAAVEAFPRAPHEDRDALARLLLTVELGERMPKLQAPLVDEPSMGRARWDVPPLSTVLQQGRDAHAGFVRTMPEGERGAALDAFARTLRRLAWPHLAQGAPTSPALANLAAHRLDVRLSALAGKEGLAYTRYADDLCFSGDFVGERFPTWVAEIARDERFRVHPRKTRRMHRGTRQRVTSIVVNEHPNVDRPTFDRLKATLTNCVRHGPASQNRAEHADFRAHLQGRIAWVSLVSPRRGEKLRALFDAIRWESS